MFRFPLTAYRTSILRTMDAAKTKVLIMDTRQAGGTAQKKFGNTDTLRHVKHKQKLKGNLPISGVVSLQICGTGGVQCPRSLILNTDHNKYLFNCGEGTQRLISEHKMKASRLEHIFITNHSWDNVGGILGMALTLQAVNVPLVTIHGPRSVEKGVQMSRNFADMKAAGVQKVELEDGDFSDHTFKIESIPLKASYDDNAAKKPKLEFDPDICVAYICRPHMYPRKVDLSKCVDLGIKSGPLLGKLKAGEIVTLEDGREIHPDQILGEQFPSRPILVLEIPSEEYLDALEVAESIQKLQSESEEGAEIILHMSPMEIVNSDRYKNWMKKFSSSTIHFVFDPQCAGAGTKSPFRCQAMLNLLHDKIFPLLPSQITAESWSEKMESNVIKVASNLSYNYRPRKQLDSSGVVMLDNQEYVDEANAQPDFTQRLEELKLQLSNIPGVYNDCKYPHFVFLGTGSSVPSNTRNVSGILFHLDENSCILLDCGEGTFGQLHRFYGPETSSILVKLKGILISHLHADHHLGVFSFLIERFKHYRAEPWYSPLDIIAPGNYRKWVNSFLREFVDVGDCMHLTENHTLLNDSNSDLCNRIGVMDIRTVSVRHCKGSFGFVIKLKDGKKVTYSGDTMPCEELVQAGMNSDLLIHEATMENDLVEEARRKTHSTTSEAINAGRDMKAKFTLLTHFSQRYAKIPVFGAEFSENVGIAFDNMRVDFDQLRLLPLFIPTLKALFAEHYAELEANIEKRQIRARAIEIAAKNMDGNSHEKVDGGIPEVK